MCRLKASFEIRLGIAFGLRLDIFSQKLNILHEDIGSFTTRNDDEGFTGNVEY